MGDAMSAEASTVPGCMCGAPEQHRPAKVQPAILEIPCCFGPGLRVSSPEHALAQPGDRSMILANRELRQSWTRSASFGSGAKAFSNFVKPAFASVARPPEQHGGVDHVSGGSNAHITASSDRHGLYMIEEEISNGCISDRCGADGGDVDDGSAIDATTTRIAPTYADLPAADAACYEAFFLEVACSGRGVPANALEVRVESPGGSSRGQVHMPSADIGDGHSLCAGQAEFTSSRHRIDHRVIVVP
mmetsp:Transcript_74673/g.207599  ORF Transcript_74673/g.207599 Transcript_74673/m.207599 type:complete len:246 (-) Transcript_74673:166-903(-)